MGSPVLLPSSLLGRVQNSRLGKSHWFEQRAFFTGLSQGRESISFLLEGEAVEVFDLGPREGSFFWVVGEGPPGSSPDDSFD